MLTPEELLQLPATPEPPEADLGSPAVPVSPVSPVSPVNAHKNSQRKKIHHGEMVQGMILKWIPQIFEAKLVQVGTCSIKLDILVPTYRCFSTSKFEQICWYYWIPQMFEAKLAQASGIPGC